MGMEPTTENASPDRYDAALTWGFRLFALLLPLVWMPGLLDFAMLPKKAVVNVAAWYFASVLFLRWRSEGKAVVRKSALLLPFVFLLFLCVPSFSLVAPNRMLALDDAFAYLSLTVILFVALHHFRDLDRVDDLLDRFLLSGAVTALIGVCQYHEIAFQWITQTESPGITFAHQNMAAEYLILLLPAASYRAMRARTAVAVYLCAFAGGLFALFTLYARARATWLGILTVCILFPIFWRMRNRATGGTASASSPFARHGRTAALAGLLLLVALAWGVPSPASKGTIDVAERVGSIFRTGEGTTPFRMEAWRSSWGMIMNHPWFGVGVGNWEIWFPRYLWIWDKKETERYFGVRDTTMGAGRGAVHTHNDYLHMITEFGVGGTIFLVMMIFLVFRSALRVCRADREGDRSLCALFALMGIVLFGVIGIFSFPFELPATSALFIIFIALLAAQENALCGSPSRTIAGKGLVSVLLVISLLLLCGATVYHFRLMMADRCAFRTMNASTNEERIALFNESLRWNWNNYDTHFQCGVFRHYAGDRYAEDYDRAVKEQWGDEVVKRIERLMLNEYAGSLSNYAVTLEMNPFRFAAMYNSGLIFQNLAVRYRNKEYMENALNEYCRILLILPDHHKAVRQIALMCCQLGEWERAKRIVEDRLMRLTENDRRYGRLLLDEIEMRQRDGQ